MKNMLKVSHKTVISNQGPRDTDYSWEVEYHDGAYPSFTISYIEVSDYKNNQHNNMTVEEAVEIALAILRMAGKNE